MKTGKQGIYFLMDDIRKATGMPLKSFYRLIQQQGKTPDIIKAMTLKELVVFIVKTRHYYITHGIVAHPEGRRGKIGWQPDRKSHLYSGFWEDPPSSPVKPLSYDI